jgi:hypothetical protein
MDLDGLPYASDPVGIYITERFHGGPAGSVEHQQASDRCLAVVGHERPRRDHLDPLGGSAVEMGAVITIVLGSRLDAILLV